MCTYKCLFKECFVGLLIASTVSFTPHTFKFESTKIRFFHTQLYPNHIYLVVKRVDVFY